MFVLLRAVLAMAFWMAISVAVALPKELLTGDLGVISSEFIASGHYQYLALLILVDLVIAVLIMNDVDLKKRVGSTAGLVLLAVAAVAAIGSSAVQTQFPNVLAGHYVEVFFTILVLYGLFRVLMYAVGFPRESGSSGRSRRSGTKGSRHSLVRTPTLTAVPVGALSPEGRRD